MLDTFHLNMLGRAWHKSFPGVIPQALGLVLHVTKPRQPLCMRLAGVGGGLGGSGVWCRQDKSQKEGHEAAPPNILGSRTFDLFEVASFLAFSLGIPNPFVHLLFIPHPLPNPNTRTVVIAANWGPSFPAQPSPLCKPCVRVTPYLFWFPPFLYLCGLESSPSEMPLTFNHFCDWLRIIQQLF